MADYYDLDNEAPSSKPKPPRFGPVQTDLDIEEAEAQGHSVEYSEPNVLLLDLDSPEDVAFSNAQSQKLRELVPHLAVWQGETWKSRNGNDHAKLTFPAGTYLDLLERLLLEVVLGGDRKRALFSYARLRNGVEARKCGLLWRPTERSRVQKAYHEIIQAVLKDEDVPEPPVAKRRVRSGEDRQ